MSKVFNSIRKLRGRSAAELRTRATQLLNATAEAKGWSRLTQVPADDEFLSLLDPNFFNTTRIDEESIYQRFVNRSEPHFFDGLTQSEATKLALRNRFDDPGVLEEARQIVDGHFNLLGFRRLDFGVPPDWHLEPLAGIRTPLEHWSQIPYLDSNRAGDKKIIWELNRHQYFSTLGRAYWRTANEVYAATFAEHIQNWMEKNSPKRGINWASSLEVSFRSIAWIWALYFFKDSPTLTPRLLLDILKFLYLHARHIEMYLSTYFSPNTHLTGEALGLFYVGTMFPEFRRATRWCALGEQILLEELDRHVRPDGVYFEQSSYYHRYTTDFYLHFHLLLARNNGKVPQKLVEKLEALLDHLMYLTRPDGTSPLFGDDDGGRLVMLGDKPSNDFRATLATGAVIFDRSDYKFVAQNVGEETLWLLGSKGLETFDEIKAKEPNNTSRAFSDGGCYIMRDGWSEDANYIVFDCGPHGSINYAHAHADALSIDVALGGKTVLVDPGTFTYTASKEMRDWFRSTQAHNTLTIDGESSSIVDGPFSWKTAASSSAKDWIAHERFDYVVGIHDGFARLSPPVLHERAILFLKCDYAVIRDRVSSTASHQADLWFHFEPNLEPLIESGTVFEPRTEAEIFAFAENDRWRQEDGWVSHCYGEKARAKVLALGTTLSADSNIITFLIPGQGTNQRANIAEVEARNGKAFKIRRDKATDVLASKKEGASHVEIDRFKADFEWSWVRFSDTGELAELVLINGSSLELDSRPLISLKDPVKYFHVRY